MKAVFLALSTLLLTCCSSFEMDRALCPQPFGIGTVKGRPELRIPDAALTASSSHSANVRPHTARRGEEIDGGAWCPKSLTTPDKHDEYLQVDLGQLRFVTHSETQGRFGNGRGKEYTEVYELQYRREENGTWFRYRDTNGESLLNGNSNTYFAELRELIPGIVARWVRFIPRVRSHERASCLRVELYGCPFSSSGLVEYSLPVGDKGKSPLVFDDETYDGSQLDGRHVGGLGQLTDGVLGVQSHLSSGRRNLLNGKGFGWVGWKRKSHNKHVELEFRFDSLRNMSKGSFHFNNRHVKDTRIPEKAVIWFSKTDKQSYDSDSLEVKFEVDILSTKWVEVNLRNRIARLIRVQLFFNARWLKISEVTFESQRVQLLNTVLPTTLAANDVTSTSATRSAVTSTTTTVAAGVSSEVTSALAAGEAGVELPDEVETTRPWTSDTTKPAGQTAVGLSDDHVGIIIGSLSAMFIVLLIIIVLLCVLHKKRRKRNDQVKSTIIGRDKPDFRQLSVKLNGHRYNTVPVEPCPESDFEPLQDPYGTTQVNGYATGLSDTFGDQDTKYSVLPIPGSENIYQTDPCEVFYATSDILANGAALSQVYGTGQRKPGGVPVPPVVVPTSTSGDVQHPQPPLQGVVGASTYVSANGSLTNNSPQLRKLPQIPRPNLRFIEKLGGGLFGEVHLCEARGLTIEGTFSPDRNTSLLVAVKTLRDGADRSAMADFAREAELLARLSDANIVRPLATSVSNNGVNPSLVVEYMRHGDLHQFLTRHSHESQPLDKHPLLSYGCLVYMARQVASGMRYLEQQNLVHRDLAARNCLVGDLYTVKISDFGMSRQLYASDYYRVEGQAMLPIRWMSWESILLGKFTCKSDVWSFGVTLWEILTLCKHQPYGELTDDQVIDNATRCYHGDSQQLMLPCPSGTCASELYDLMCECWNAVESRRPSFTEIHMFLLRKNMGYDPSTEPSVNLSFLS